MHLSYFGYKAALRTMQGYWDKVREYGKEPNPSMGGFAQLFGVAATEKRA